MSSLLKNFFKKSFNQRDTKWKRKDYSTDLGRIN